MIDSAGTQLKAYEALMREGAKKVVIYATHLLLNGPAEENIKKMNAEIIGTDTFHHSKEKLASLGIKVLPMSKIFGEAIKRKHLGKSTKDLFDPSQAHAICGIDLTRQLTL
jgi:ribose-phosphate pyrophosphokinase